MFGKNNDVVMKHLLDRFLGHPFHEKMNFCYEVDSFFLIDRNEFGGY